MDPGGCLRRNQRRQFLISLTLFVVACFAVINFMYRRQPSSYQEKYPSGLHTKDTHSANEFKQRAAIDENEEFVSVPLRQIMSGEPLELPQNDQRIINYIWDNRLIEPPSKEEYNLKKPDEDPSRGQGQFIRKLLSDMKDGFFVECGALDGETRSNTLYMEQHLGWKGLLIEGDPSNYALMKEKNRKAWTASTCLSIKPYPHHAEFMQSFNVGKILDTTGAKKGRKTAKVQCMPLFSLLTALNVTTVDYFSLDVEGSELQVLKTIPFKDIFIRTLSVEFLHTTEGKDTLLKFMKSQGYKLVGEVRYPGDLANDFMFVYSSIEVPFPELTSV